MELEVVETDRTFILRVEGSIQTYNELSRIRCQIYEILEEGTRFFVLNLGGVEFMNSTTIGGLIGIVRRLKAEGGILAACSLMPGLKRAFSILGLARLVPICETEEEAKEAVMRIAAKPREDKQMAKKNQAPDV